MTVRPDSYATVDDIKTFTRHLLDGASTFSASTRPTLTEVENFINRASAELNVALRGEGLQVPIVNTTAVLSCDQWVIEHAVLFVEATQRGVGYSDQEGSRMNVFSDLRKSAIDFAKMYRTAFIDMGVTCLNRKSEGLAFTGLDSIDQRDDPTDNTKRQPLFRRQQFDEPKQNTYTRNVDGWEVDNA